MLEIQADAAVAALNESWLAHPASSLLDGLPQPLRAAFEADTRRARSRTAGIISLFGGVVGAGFYPMLANAVPNQIPALNHLFLELFFPIAIACSLLVLLDPWPRLRELLLAAPCATAATVITWLFVASGQKVTEMFVTGMILLMLFATVTVQLRFQAALGVIILDMALFVVGVACAPDISADYRQSLDVIGGVCALYMLLANWRLNATQQRSYLLNLRERQRLSALARQNVELTEQASTDPLTGLANRRVYDAWLRAAWSDAIATGAPVGLIMLDVDHFKSYNDLYGHPAGDACLRRVAECLRAQTRLLQLISRPGRRATTSGGTDLVARVGGEEFAVVLPGANLAVCEHVAHRLRLAVANLALPHAARGRSSIVTVSCGCSSLLALRGTTPQGLCAAADAALYVAKQSGRNRVGTGVEPAEDLPAIFAAAAQTISQ